MPQSGFTSRQAARLSGVPFDTVDYWDRSSFIKPSIARATGRGRGRGRTYSYTDVLRLRIARELRDQKVSLETLRHVVRQLGKRDGGLAEARFVFVGRKIELARDFEELTAVLRAGKPTFGFVLDLSGIQEHVAAQAAKLSRATEERASGRSLRR